MVSQAPSTYEMDMPHPETGAMTPQEVPVTEEYVPEFDIKINIGAEKPQDREYWVQSALTLLQTIDPMTQMPMIDAKAVQYTIQNGRMEPMHVIQERMGVEQQQVQKVQQLEQENAVLNEMVNQLHGHVQEAQGVNGQATNDTLKTLQDGQQQDHAQQLQLAQHEQASQQQAHSQMMDKAKLMIEAAKVKQAGEKANANSKSKG